MSIRLFRRSLLYVFSLVFIAFGLVGLFAPAMLILGLHLRPITLAGLGEMRGLYGGGFTGFGIVTLAGLRGNTNAPGLLLALAIIFAGIVVGRVFSLVFDQDLAFTAQTAIPEFIFALCCYGESRAGLPHA